jgi:hypothetical protein
MSSKRNKPRDVDPAEAVPCPKCHAARWINCVGTKKTHRARQEAWEQELQKRIQNDV